MGTKENRKRLLIVFTKFFVVLVVIFHWGFLIFFPDSSLFPDLSRSVSVNGKISGKGTFLKTMILYWLLRKMLPLSSVCQCKRGDHGKWWVEGKKQLLRWPFAQIKWVNVPFIGAFQENCYMADLSIPAQTFSCLAVYVSTIHSEWQE